MVTALHTASSDLRWHPHALASRGGWDHDGTWHPVPYVDEKAAELLFRRKALSLLAQEGLLGPDETPVDPERRIYAARWRPLCRGAVRAVNGSTVFPRR